MYYMSGHNKWSKVKHKKVAVDVKKSKLWSKITQDMIIALKDGGSNIDINFKLRKLIEYAKSVNMPKVNITRILNKYGKKNIDMMHHLFYDCYAKYGVQILVECLSDNRNRSCSLIKSLLLKYGAKFASTSHTTISYNFHKKGCFYFNHIDKTKISENDIINSGIDHGIDDVISNNKCISVICDYNKFYILQEQFKKHNIMYDISNIIMIPQKLIKLSKNEYSVTLKLINMLKKNRRCFRSMA